MTCGEISSFMCCVFTVVLLHLMIMLKNVFHYCSHIYVLKFLTFMEQMLCLHILIWQGFCFHLDIKAPGKTDLLILKKKKQSTS